MEVAFQILSLLLSRTLQGPNEITMKKKNPFFGKLYNVMNMHTIVRNHFGYIDYQWEDNLWFLYL